MPPNFLYSPHNSPVISLPGLGTIVHLDINKIKIISKGGLCSCMAAWRQECASDGLHFLVGV